MMSGGGFKSKSQAKLKDLASFQKEIQEDTSISEITKQELSETAEGISQQSVSGTKGGKEFNRRLAEARGALDEARAGTAPKFKARQQRAQQRRLITDQPGRAQTVLTR